MRDFYVDDLLTGSSTLQEALEIKKQTVELLERDGFKLTKWSSNHSSLQDVEGRREKELEIAVDRNSETRALGVVWNCKSNVFKFTSVEHHPTLEKPTKRSILSRIALV